MKVFWDSRFSSGTGLQFISPNSSQYGFQLSLWANYQRPSQHYSSRPCCSRVSHCGTMNCFEFPCHGCNHHSLSSIPPCHCLVRRCWPMFMPSPLLNKQRRDELERTVDHQLKELQSSQQTQVPSSSSSSTSDSENEEDTAAGKHRPSRSELVSCSVNTEISCLRKPYTHPETRPAWRYWKRGSAELQHKQPGNDKIFTIAIKMYKCNTIIKTLHELT